MSVASSGPKTQSSVNYPCLLCSLLQHLSTGQGLYESPVHAWVLFRKSQVRIPSVFLSSSHMVTKFNRLIGTNVSCIFLRTWRALRYVSGQKKHITHWHCASEILIKLHYILQRDLLIRLKSSINVWYRIWASAGTVEVTLLKLRPLAVLNSRCIEHYPYWKPLSK